jgi:DNA-binding response OmpR family regulator
MADRVLMIEDDSSLSAMVAEYLRPAGIEVTARPAAAEGLALLARCEFDAVILDLMLPDLDGLEVCRRLRAESDVPILMLTARGDDADRIVGLELGADDYLPKPFNPRELLARLRAILRRRGPGRSTPSQRFGRLTIDRDARRVRVDGEERPLTSYQFDLLSALATHAGRVMSREALMDRLRGAAPEAFDRSIDVHVSRIRAAIEDDPRHPRRLLTVRGAGYVFARRQDEEPGG